MEGTVVLGRGRSPNRVMLVGEGPGADEAAAGRPFVGRSGKEQDRYLQNEGFNPWSAYYTNVGKVYHEGNPDPTPAEIIEWTPVLVQELLDVSPSIVLSIGRVATRWFLGDDVDMEMVHGIPHRSSRCPGAVVMPCYHPAAGFYDDEIRALIAYDYKRAVAAINNKIDLNPPIDKLAGQEVYRDVTGTWTEGYFRNSRPGPFAIDTEGTPDDPWSIQWSTAAGVGYVLRCSQPDFAVGIRAIRDYALTPGVTTVMQNAMYDLEMCRVMGADLFECSLFDTRYAAYLLRLEPQALKPLLYRWCGMRQPSYDDTIGPVGIVKQLNYLTVVGELTADWPKPEARIEYDNDGTMALYTPQPIFKRALAIIDDYHSGKLDKEGKRTDPLKRWKKCDRDLRKAVEREFGPMPIGTLADIPIDQAVRYSCRDADGTLRLYHRIRPALAAQKLSTLMNDGCGVLPLFEEMQSSGMPFDRAYCERMSAAMWKRMCELQSRISNRFYGGAPFNPGSADQVAALMRRRGLVGEKYSKKTRKMSTAKKSIEHLRHTDDAMADVIDWREHQKMKDSFYDAFIERLDDLPDQPIRTHINPYKVVSRRISSSDPNLTAVPVRNELGVQVRDGSIAPDGYVFGSWDLSQIEMRYMAHESRDPLLCRFFHENKDVHAETASRIFRIPLTDVQEMAHRYPAKRAAFGIITNIQGPGLYDQLRMAGCEGWDVDKCDQLIDDWLTVYGGVRRYMDAAKDEALKHGYVRDHWGMIRYLPGIWSQDNKTRAEAERAASSMKIQGGAQGMLQQSMLWLKPYIRELRSAGVDVTWRLQIHDEIILMFPEDAWELINPLVIEGLTEHNGIRLVVPVKAKGSYAKSWGKLKA